MSQSIKSISNKLKQKPKPREQDYQIHNDSVISEVGVRIYKSFLKRHSNNPNILFRSLDLKNNFQKSQLSDYEKKNLIKQMLNRSIDERVNYLSIADEYFVSNQSKPSVFNLEFSKQRDIKQKESKVRFNSTHRRLLIQKKLGSTLKLQHKIAKDQKNQTIEENPEVERVRNNRFPPRVCRLDYTKPNTQILNKYLKKFEVDKKGEGNQTQHQFPALSQISHLEQLQKFKAYLLQYQSDQKYRVLPKMSINAVEHENLQEKPPQLSKSPAKHKLAKVKRQQKQQFNPWQSDQYYRTIQQAHQKLM